MTTGTRTPAPAGAKREWIAYLIAWIPYALLVKAFWFVTDDAFISFRFARNGALGNGLRYNLGDHVPVEGYSNFLWVMACSVVERLGGDIAFWAPLLSFAAGSVLLLLVLSVLRRFGLSAPLAVLATWSMGAFAPYFVWSTGGLATVPFTLAVFWAFERLALRRAGPAPIAAGLAGAAAALLRVEGVAWVVLAGAGAAVSWRLAGRKSLAPLVPYAAIVAVAFGAFLLWRHDYYGSWVANTAAAKVGWSGALFGRGLEYVAVHVLTFLTPLLLLPAAIVALRRELRPLGLPVVGLAAASYGYAVAVGGDFMALGRLLVPGLPFSALLIGWLLQWVVERRGGRPAAALALGAIVVFVSLLPAADIHIVPESVRTRFNVRRHWNKYWTEIEYWSVMRLNGGRWKRLGLALKEYADPGSSVVAPGIGYIGYYSDLFVHDQAGLVSREVAHRPGGEVTVPGHDKMVTPEFFLEHEPMLISPYLAEEGAEFERTMEDLRRESRRLSELGADYSVVSWEPFTTGPAPPRTHPSAEAAILANLLAPFHELRRPTGPRELVCVLRRDDG